jgi:hypothetical protein
MQQVSATDRVSCARFCWTHCLACAYAKRGSTRSDYMLFMEFIVARHPKGGIMQKIPDAIPTYSFRSDPDRGVRLISESGQEVCLKDLVGMCSLRANSALLPNQPSS